VIFVDTSFWIALALPEDDRASDARELVRRCEAEKLVTSNHVRGETWTFLRRRDGHVTATAFLDMLEQSDRTRVDRIDTGLEEDALAWLRRHHERSYSFVDATSFALMRSLGIREVLAFDGDFAAAGFVELRAD
jgi:predicted nucleic acid-binding protein